MTASLVDLQEGFSGQGFTSAPKCPVCAGASAVLHGANNIHPEKPYTFDFRVCIYCAHGWIDPMPSQALLSYLYGRGSHSVIGVGWADQEPLKLTIPERLVERLELCDAGGRKYFELGVGKGKLYQKFADRGWNCTGVEPGAWGSGLENIYPDIDLVPASLAADLLVALDVLEHVADPCLILRKLRKVAAPGATLYGAMPNTQSFRARLQKGRWRMVRPLGHVHYWSRKSITLATQSAGFRLNWMKTSDLSDPQKIKTPRELCFEIVQALGLGDQCIFLARAI
jgi:hypothetical protein